VSGTNEIFARLSSTSLDVKYNKWSKKLDKKPHRRRTWTIQSHSPGCANVHPSSNICFFRPTPSPYSKRHLDRFSRFCRAYDRDRETDKQTDKPRYIDVDDNRPHIYVRSTTMRPNLKKCLIRKNRNYRISAYAFRVYTFRQLQ